MTEKPLLKRPRIEVEEEKQKEKSKIENGKEFEEEIKNEREEALSALVEHRTKEVEHLRQRVDYYQSQLDHSEKKLEDAKSKLAHLRSCESLEIPENLANGKEKITSQRTSTSPTRKRHDPSPNRLTPPRRHQDTVNPPGDSSKFVRRPSSPFNRDEDPSGTQLQSNPKLMIPSVPSNTSQQPLKIKESRNKISSGSRSLCSESPPTHIAKLANSKGDKARQSTSKHEAIETQSKAKKLKPVRKEHTDLIPLIAKSSSAVPIRTQIGCVLSSQHKRKLRSLVLCPTNDQLFVTSALDGVINLWEIQGKGSGATLLSTTDCQSEKQRRWPEDLAWHPQGNKIISVYTADGGDFQISVLDLNKGKEKARVRFLEQKPHIKGIINSVAFMPWDHTSFVTGGSDHAVIVWKENHGEDSWKPKSLHRSYHSSAVMGIAGIQHRNVVMSAGADKRIIGFDVQTGRAEYKHQIDSKCMSVLPNPSDFNLFMVQTATPERQLRLFDLRIRQMEVHTFGWKQESSETQSALINQAWSPDGLYITSGSADPVIHIFDIRHNSQKPSQSIKAHQKRVFKAAWHHALPLLISISSDLNIGLHKIL